MSHFRYYTQLHSDYLPPPQQQQQQQLPHQQAHPLQLQPLPNQHGQVASTSIGGGSVISSGGSSSATPSENTDDEGIGSSLADLDSLTDLLPMMAPELVSLTYATIHSNSLKTER